MKDTELIRAKSFSIGAVAYSFNNLVRCECHRGVKLYFVIIHKNVE